MRQFFEDGSGVLSMTRLLTFMSFWPASAVLLWIPSEGTLGLYLGAYVGGYLGGKALDRRYGEEAGQPQKAG